MLHFCCNLLQDLVVLKYMFGVHCGSLPGCFLLVLIFLSVVLLVGGKINSEFFKGGGGWKV